MKIVKYSDEGYCIGDKGKIVQNNKPFLSTSLVCCSSVVTLYL